MRSEANTILRTGSTYNPRTVAEPECVCRLPSNVLDRLFGGRLTPRPRVRQ